MPKSDHVFRGGVYTRWAGVCGGLVAYHGITGFLATRDAVPDADAEVWGSFLMEWRKIFSRPAGEGARPAGRGPAG